MAVWASSKIVQLDVTGVSTLSGIFLAGLFPHVLPFGSDKPTQAAEYEGFTARFNSLNVRSGSSVSIPRASAILRRNDGIVPFTCNPAKRAIWRYEASRQPGRDPTGCCA
ncbi:hypothetical protein MA20_35020 [Bradyrhizobium japonicum]|uniref:Uncharacterized protein n=1 Tax=Bradyrhizobium japonicum TaxID=375 RepID=A0A0A3XPF4_BRAJP|nr:hypothetical protein MA20_35020 [Bradyrhizobium japonicum]